MNKASQAWAQIMAVNDLSDRSSPMHTIHPLAKLLAVIAYIFTVVSFPKYDLTGIFVMVLYPVLLYQLADIPIRTCFRSLRFVLPLVLAVSIVNPFLDTVPYSVAGLFRLPRGCISMVTLMLKGTFTLLISFLLIATTKVEALCAALRRLHVPEVMVTLFLLTYRYVAVLMEQVSIMLDAYMLRAPGQNGIHISAWGSFLGQLLLRSMDKAKELYQSMLLRGFDGSFSYLEIPPFSRRDWVFLACSAAFFLTARATNLAVLFGSIFVR